MKQMPENIKKVQMHMNNLLENIISYLKYLNGELKLTISVHFEQNVFDHLSHGIVSTLLPYNSHTNAYCVMTKSVNHNKCILNQKDILNKCRKHESFLNICHAGVSEYIYPICRADNVVGFVAASGYRQKRTENTEISNYHLWKSVLSREIPVKLFEAVTPPLCIMLEQLLAEHSILSGSEYSQILQFLNEYHTSVALSDLAKHFGRSKSHISHLFKKESGMTIRAYCNHLKLIDAKKLLLTTDLPITEIAFNVGFNDTSYFIALFRKEFGITPLQYRYENK